MATQTAPTVTKLETASTRVMECDANGNYAERDVLGTHLWMCDGCRLVWEKRWHAETCETRGHIRSFEQGPYGVTHVENGVPKGANIRYYTRRAVRRQP